MSLFSMCALNFMPITAKCDGTSHVSRVRTRTFYSKLVCGGLSNAELIEWMPWAFEQFSGWLYDYNYRYGINWFGLNRFNKNPNGVPIVMYSAVRFYEMRLNVPKWYDMAWLPAPLVIYFIFVWIVQFYPQNRMSTRIGLLRWKLICLNIIVSYI